jgi:hypothetical protein
MYDQGMEGWRAVTLEMPMPYFLVEYALCEGDLWHEKATIMWRDADLIDFCKSALVEKHARILQIQLLALVDGAVPRKWGAIPISELWSGRLRGKDGRAAVCMDPSGQRMKSNEFTHHVEIEKLDELVFCSKN